jgi:hypothetical protein
VLEDWRARLILAELRKVILVASQFFEFLHSLGQSLPNCDVRVASVYLSNADIHLSIADMRAQWRRPENTHAEILLARTAPSASVIGSQSDVAAPYGFPSRRP